MGGTQEVLKFWETPRFLWKSEKKKVPMDFGLTNILIFAHGFWILEALYRSRIVYSQIMEVFVNSDPKEIGDGNNSGLIYSLSQL